MRTSSMTSAVGYFACVAVVIAASACDSSQPASERQPAPAAPRVVDIGYGEMPAHLTSTSVTSLSAEQIRSRSVREVAELFETIAGVTVDRTRGRTSVRVRSVASNQSAVNTEPLIIVDGVPLSRYDRTNGLAALQTMDIERIDVLKDAAAAMYGVRGGRGVILVKTKRGRR